MDFIEFCNNSLYAGLKALQDNPKYQYLIFYNGIACTNYFICEKENRIYISNNQKYAFGMDLNDFVKNVQDNIIEIKVIERI